MSASNAFETLLLQLLLQNANIANLGDATGVRGSTTAGNVYVALHTADPGEAGDQTTSEATYTSYARAAVPRTSAAWSVSGNTASNLATVSFPACTGGTNALTYFSVGFAASGASVIIVSGPLNSPATLNVSTGITPSFAIGALTGTVD